MDISRVALNRIICPRLSLEDFFALTAGVGLHAVELRNDLPGRSVLDGAQPRAVRDIARKHALTILTINAIQQFNLPARVAAAIEETRRLAAVAAEIGCRALVFCPNNDRADNRSEAEVIRDTTVALKTLAPILEDSGLEAYVEPLGFPECTLASKRLAHEAIAASGTRCCRLLYDTFHHAIGPDNSHPPVAAADIGLVHVSGVTDPKPDGGYRDEHRVLVTAGDRIGNKSQIAALEASGYTGSYAFEPFSPRIQSLPPEALKKAIAECLALLGWR